MHERLFVCVPPSHALAQHSKTLSFSKINGFNFLLRTELGFWDTHLPRKNARLPHFSCQTDPEVFNEAGQRLLAAVLHHETTAGISRRLS